MLIKVFSQCVISASLLVIGAQVFASGEAVISDGTLTFDVAIGDYPESNPYVYGQALPAGVTAIVKKGSGSVTLGAFDNSSFTGTVEVEANGGYLMGNVKAFGKASEIVVRAGGAVEFLETAKDGTMGSTHFKIAGAGPDGKGALIRPNANPGTAHDFFKTITLLDDASINTGSRWGLAGGTLNMGNHTLTLRNDRHVAENWSKDYACFDITYTVSVKDPGAIVVESGLLSFQIMGSSQPKLVDAKDSNGTISNMTITVRGDSGSRVRLMGVEKGCVPCRLVTEGTPTLMNDHDSPADNLTLYSNWDGPVTIGSTALTLALYSGSSKTNCFVFNNEVSGVGVMNHDIAGQLFFTGGSTNTFSGITQHSSGVTHVTDDVHLNLTNAVVNIAGGTVAEPSTLVLSDNASIVEIPTPTDRMKRTAWRIGEGRNVLTKSEYGLLKIYDGAVVSNDVTLGLRGYGACYQFGGRLNMIDGKDGNGTVMIGSSSGAYGYLGIDGGVFEQGSWCYLGKDSPGFMVQRGGVAYQGMGIGNVPLRIAFSGANTYGHYAVLGGKAIWKNYAALNFSGFSPTSKSGVGSFTVDGEGAVVDMSSSRILSVPSTNDTDFVTALVNVGHGGKLKVKYVAVEQVINKDSPSWDSIKADTPRGTKTYLNLNGGIVIAAQAGEFFKENDSYRLPTRTTVYENGFVFDTDGKDVTWRAPLERPYGYGIKSLTLPAEALVPRVLLGPSRCRIVSSGAGVGADALMDFDNTNRVVRGMLVTSPGFGYEETPTVTVQKADASSSSTWACTVETVNYDAANFKHGGLTKRGAGTLTVSGANTYGGATRMEGGTLAFTHASGLPTGSSLEFAAAALPTSGDEMPLLRAPAYNGGEVCVTEADTLEKESFKKLKTIARFDAPLAGVPTLKLLNMDGSRATGTWRLALSSDRKSLRFGVSRGFVVVFR